jgi:para-nitrobenzyl esterase
MFATDFGLPDDLMAGYRAGMPNAPVLDIYLAIFGDLMFGEFTCRLAERQAQSGGRAFMSRFARHRNDAGQVVRAWHCSDIPSAFGNLDNDGAAFLVGGTSNAADRDLSRRMVRAWADFATTGDPGWPPIMGSTTPVRTWNADDTAATATATATATDEPLDRRALWRNVDLPFLPL